MRRLSIMSFYENPEEEKREIDRRAPIKSTWNTEKLLMGKELTDRKIGKYEKMGWYSAERRQKRRELLQEQRLKRELRELKEGGGGLKRDGNFIIYPDGRWIYSPT